MNQCDSQIIRETLASWGLTESKQGESGDLNATPADLIIINTCTVTSSADAKFHKALRRIKREDPRALIAVTGCYANSPTPSSQLVGVGVVFKPHDFSSLADSLRAHNIISVDETLGPCGQSYFAEHTRAFMKIQDGCDCNCAYCIVPIVRPILWSESPQTVVRAINSFSAKGYKEVVLTGIHLGFYGRDSGQADLASLLVKIEQECEIDRVRLSSIEINEVSDEILELMASSKKFCHHLHLPLQSGNDEILRAMGRRYSVDTYKKRVGEIRKKLPDVGITTDVIVGFPGETDKHFEHTCMIVREMEFTKIHVFRYSPRPDTRAAVMDSQVLPNLISKRARQLIMVGEETAQKFKADFIGRTLQVLTEKGETRGSTCTGLAPNYIRVKVLDVPADCVGQILPVRLTGIDEHTGIALGRMI